MKHDIVYPLKMGSDGEELRYSLRSLVNFPHGKVFVVGDLPEWANENVIHVPMKEYAWHVPGNPYLDAEARWMSACEDDRVSDTFWLFNDDFFIMQPFNDKPFPSLHKGQVLPTAMNTYHANLMRTRNMLMAHTENGVLNYELHAPMRMEKDKRRAINLFLSPEMRAGKVYLMRTVYGTVYGIDGKLQDDVKDPPEADWVSKATLSTSDESFKHKLGSYIRSQFTKPSIYERSGDGRSPAHQ